MRLQAARRLLAFSATVCALASGAPALAQAEGSYVSAPPAAAGVAQPLPVPPLPMAGAWDDDQGDLPPPLAPVPPIPPAPPHAAYSQLPGAYGTPQAYAAPYPYPAYAQQLPPQFDRDGWLANCHDRIRGVDHKDRAGVIGGLLGAAVGGVVGNRVWDSQRLAGTLLGAGVGGLAGVAIGNAVGEANERRHEDECALYLNHYIAGGHGYLGYAHGYPGYGYGGYALIPVLVAVPQRQVVRETVTEEWVDAPVRSRSIPPRHQAAPRAAKPTKYIKIR